MSEDADSGDDGARPRRVDGTPDSHGFDPASTLNDGDGRSHRRLSPANRIAKRAQFAPPSGGALPVLDSDERLVFASDNYLGLTQDSEIQDAAVAAAEVVGTGSGASRTATGDTLVHRDLEHRLAETTGTDRALVFPSGYAAVVATITALEPDVVFSDVENHTAVTDACCLADAGTVHYDHLDVADLADRLASRADADADESWLLVTESVFGTDGTVAPLAELCELADRYGAWLLVDETHAVGLYEDGGGIVQRDGLTERVNVQTGSLSTALASQGGYVAGDDVLIELLIDRREACTFSAGLAPPSAAAAVEALHVARTEDHQEQLWRNAEYLRDQLAEMGYEVEGSTQILAVPFDDPADAVALCELLYDRGVVARAVDPPGRSDATSRLLVTPMATHSASDLAACLDAFRDAGREIGLL